ncbi:sn-glycerol-3-phosphate ABC transporter ATP-binding protein UgpC [Jiella sp. MQZ9-1]|uniref:Sn-glycerol-3-phosphate ABC transporter ATP-binding protein UgpC n=1 Tax=Jiella flava TaxID=2816857 RepID=A0A939FTE0_9HYPH|nr:sn-glycerol-3-phosphate ABC transporter ATP-binding protein UgpC [Jiella flava]MBO0661212.1 sn-glycerol-3-phosphate ABC transporter ATP-binding protein UgpC [Jiella flava]MCD2469857.1 sn-glycerol-3-phosphate ABC transporter ATP-binding protein UgpC [Jiella flava]
MAVVELDKLVKDYGDMRAIHGVDLTIEDGEFCVFVGPSGCGKSTLLRMIAGLEEISSGELRIDGTCVNEQRAAERGLAMVFQTYALYPHMTVRENLGFGLENIKTPKDEIRRRVDEAARMLQIGDYLDRRPKQLSGGQRQRVAIGRAVVREPKVFLFDEPLSNLDAELRVVMRGEISSLHRRLGNTMIYVTHDQVEAMTMADKIVVLKAGLIQQVGSPLDLYNRPANQFVAGFIGSPRMNFMAMSVTKVESDGIVVADTNGRSFTAAVSPDGVAPGDAVTIGVRPEHLEIGSERGHPVTVETIEQLGGESYLYCKDADGHPITVHKSGQTKIKAGDAAQVFLPEESIHVFKKDGTALTRLRIGEEA